MNPEQQRIAIAEWCGLSTDWSKSSGFQYLPGYLNDLNAMHEAEKFMEENRPTLCFEYSDNLRMVINPGAPVGDFRLIHATAAQRAEALLRTIGKWTATDQRKVDA